MKKWQIKRVMQEIDSFLPDSFEDNFNSIKLASDAVNDSDEEPSKRLNILCTMADVALKNCRETFQIKGKNKEKLRVWVHEDREDTDMNLIEVTYTNRKGYTVKVESPFV